MSIVPEDWTRMIGQLRTAQVARDTMRDPHAMQQARDAATAEYVRAADEVIACLSRLSERQVLGRITLLLSRRERP